MSDKRKIYVLGRSTVTPIEAEDLHEIGQALAICNRQLVTVKGVAGVAASVDAGFTEAGGTTEYIDPGTIPDTKDVIIFVDTPFQARIEARVEDWQKRGWLMINDIHAFNIEMLKALQHNGRTMPTIRVLDGGSARSGRRGPQRRRG